MALINCPDCGKEVSDSAPSCIHCGCVLKVKMITCPECGKENKEDSKVCNGCGFSFTPATNPQQVAVVNHKSTSKKMRDVGLILSFATQIVFWVMHFYMTYFVEDEIKILFETNFDHYIFYIIYYIVRIISTALTVLLVVKPGLRKKSLVLLTVVIDLIAIIAIFIDSNGCLLVILMAAYFIAQLLKFISLFVKDEE